MKNNIVQIRTYKSRGTGILYPCSYSKEDRGYKSYLIFTCAHIFEDIQNMPGDGEDISNLMGIVIYDDYGKKIKEEDMKSAIYHISQTTVSNIYDVAAILIQIKSYNKITLETKIYKNQLENREIIYVEGYPRVMLDDEINQKVQLRGMHKEMFPDKNAFGMYQIKDDYHWYNDYNDLKLMEGFSGSPVYIENDDKIYLLGMNQSIANIEKGENPFKIVYYLKMQYIIDCLRESNCIIFDRNEDGSLNIEWVLNLYNSGKDLTLLMLGGSGAGKSTFAKSFAYHESKLNTTNDGQTTRSNIFYHFSLFPDKCQVKVNFFSKKEFKEKMNELVSIRKWLCFLGDIAGIYGVKEDTTCVMFLKNIYPFFRSFRGIEKTSNNEEIEKKKSTKSEFIEKGKKIEKSINNILTCNYEIDEIVLSHKTDIISSCYEMIINFLWTYIPLEYWKYCYDTYIFQKWTKDRKSEINIEKILENDNSVFATIIRSSLKKLFSETVVDNTKEWEKYQNKLKNSLIDNIENIVNESREALNEEILRSFFNSLLHIEGFFDVKEIYFLNYSSSRVEFSERKKSKGKNLIIDQEDEDEDTEQYEGIIKYVVRACNEKFESLYELLEDYMKDIWEEGSLIFDLENNLEKEKEELLTKCFQLTKKGSLTSFIKTVLVEDKVSDIYAQVINKCNIENLFLIDTCGLDHVKDCLNDIQKVRNILTAYYECMPIKDKKSEEISDNIAVLYLKKLDAGKPDELRNIIPTIANAIPKSPIYCIFTGIDIYYEQCDIKIADLRWDDSCIDNLPKAVKFLLPDSSIEDYSPNYYYEELDHDYIGEKVDYLFSRAQISETRKRNLYLVMKNNLIPFSGNRGLVTKCYDYYKSNQNYIRKLLSSILVDEVGSMEIIDINNAKTKFESEKVRTIIKELLSLVFEKATVKNWNNFHYTISKADFVRLYNTDRVEMGYFNGNNNVRLRWEQLFHDAYSDVMKDETVTNALLTNFDERYRSSIEAAILSVGETYFLGPHKMLSSRDFTGDKNEFRIELESMYSEKDIYDDNPLIKSDKPVIKFREANIGEAIKYLRNVTNFLRGYEYKDYKERFCDIFVKALIKQIKENNSVKAEGMLRVNENFNQAFMELEKTFDEKYGDLNLLYSLLIEYFEKKR